jgi:hypothetical protein
MKINSQRLSRTYSGVMAVIMLLILTATMASAVTGTKEKKVPVIPAIIPAAAFKMMEFHRTTEHKPIWSLVDRKGIIHGIDNCRLIYDIQATKTGNYAIKLQVSSILSYLWMRVELDDIDITGKLVIPNTGSWNNFVDVTSNKVAITAGKHQIKIFWDDTSEINFLLPRLKSIKIENYKPLAIRVNAGDYMDYTDSEGNVWQPDTGFVDGECVERGEGVIIKNSKDVRIYRTEHFGMSRFSLKVPNGNYVARLHFAETFDDRRPGSRVFKLNVNGTEFPKFDLIGEAGGCYKALIKTVPVKVSNGEFYITFYATNMPSVTINGIELLETETPAAKL